jgi:carboxypeptidase D
MANNSLFFWAFEKENGSMTAESDKPWGLWLAGGPGYSSIASLLLENGPIRMNATTLDFQYNEWSWSNLADWFWVDNPVGTGFATVGKGGYCKLSSSLKPTALILRIS